MNRITKVFRTLRNNWKKSTFAFCVLSYGVNYGHDKIRTNEMMREYCEEAISYGNIPISREEPKRVTVILNPAAKKKKAKKQFEKYCAPLLHLAGMYVSIVQTDAEGQARGLMEVMGNTDAVAIAGGDGTISEAVTGLLRRPDGVDVAAKLPMAVLPLGRTNAVATSIFGQEEKEAKFLAEATMSLIRGSSRLFDAMKIEPLQSDPEVTAKPVYALAEVQWGAYRDTRALRDKYWIWGPLRAYVGALFCWPKQELSWDCQAELTYVATCEGCKSCQGKYSKAPQTNIQTHSQGRWWHSFLPRSNYSSTNSNIVDYNKVLNPDCGIQHTRRISTTDFSIATVNARPYVNDTCKPPLQTLQTPELKISIGLSQEELAMSDFVSEMWHREKGETPRFSEMFTARELWFRPIDENKEFITEPKEKPVETEQTEDKKSSDEAKEAEKWFSIDQENFELRPMHITLLPKSVRLFCPGEQVVQ